MSYTGPRKPLPTGDRSIEINSTESLKGSPAPEEPARLRSGFPHNHS